MPLKLFDNILKLQGFEINTARKEFDNLVSNGNVGLQNRKESLVKHHLTNNRFYNTLAVNKEVIWKDLPVLSKRNLQQPLHERLSKNYTIKNIFKGKTSGSSGNPFTYGKNKYAHAMTWAAFHHVY